MAITRDEAWALLTRYNKEPFHLRHAVTLEGCMRWFAQELGFGDEADFWAAVGLLHDIDYEMFPDEHCRRHRQLLGDAGVDGRIIDAIATHGWPRHVDTPPTHRMEKVLYAVDELTGLIGAAALMRPSKSVQDLEVKSVMKKYKTPAFAAGCSRDVIARGAELLGWELEHLVGQTILAMRTCEDAAAEAAALA